MKVRTPVPGVTAAIVGVSFVDGEGDTDEPRALAYFRRHGYHLGDTPARVGPAIGAPRGPGIDVPVGEVGVLEATPERPANSASKAAWLAYAVACGADEAEVRVLTRNALAERYGARVTEG